MSDTAKDVAELLRLLADNIEAGEVSLSRVEYKPGYPNDIARLDVEWWGDLE